MGIFALGCGDGRVMIMGTKKGKSTKLAAKNVGVEDIQWDPNSPNYLLASWKDGSMSLFDYESEKEMMSFERQGSGTLKLIMLPHLLFFFSLSSCLFSFLILIICNLGITAIAWIKSIPGGFVTCNEKAAAIKIWNVANK